MNKQRRKQLGILHDELEGIKDRLETLLAEEEDYIENFPENMQSSDRYETAEEARDQMDEAVCELDNILGNVAAAMGH